MAAAIAKVHIVPMSDRFYINGPLGPGDVVLEGPEAHHLVVSRFRPGDRVSLFNGDGREYTAEIMTVERRRVTLRVTAVAAPPRELPFSLVVAAPLPKGDRAQFLVEKLTELGVTTLLPLSTRRSVVHPRETKLEKLQRHVIEASKQCGRNVLMQVEALTDWETYCVRVDLAATRIVAHPQEPRGTEHADTMAALPAAPICLAVGPEGGFTNEEIGAARQAGWQTLDLGPRILRVETAALVLAAWTVRAWQLQQSAGVP
jgi:16S rRNA (uracil1498-N3)-methyltransferase